MQAESCVNTSRVPLKRLVPRAILVSEVRLPKPAGNDEVRLLDMRFKNLQQMHMERPQTNKSGSL